jgi:DNA-3-methyladenine glycosylase II
VDVEVRGPWSLATSKVFWEGFTPSALGGQEEADQLRSVFCAEGDWRRAEVEVTQEKNTARLVVTGDGDLDTAAVQVCRFLALDVARSLRRRAGRAPGCERAGRRSPPRAASGGRGGRALRPWSHARRRL